MLRDCVCLQSKKSVKEADNVRVVVRCRPLNEKEVSNGNQMAVKVNKYWWYSCSGRVTL